MKKVVSVSLGSSKRDHDVVVSLLGETFEISRKGTDGDFKKAMALLQELDGHVDAIGLGGIDVYLYAGEKRYPLRDGLRLLNVVKKTPVVDGSGLKNTLEREVIHSLNKTTFPLTGKKVLMVSALDRFGMAQAFAECGANLVFGDFIFALGFDKPITSMDELAVHAEKLLPEIGKLPIGFLYPIGKNQESQKGNPAFFHYYEEADIIAGDFHFIKKHMPPLLQGKFIVTNTITPSDVENFRNAGVSTLITTTPELHGRSFGTNVLEAVFLALLGKKWEETKPEDYQKLLQELHLKPRIEKLN